MDLLKFYCIGLFFDNFQQIIQELYLFDITPHNNQTTFLTLINFCHFLQVFALLDIVNKKNNPTMKSPLNVNFIIGLLYYFYL